MDPQRCPLAGKVRQSVAQNSLGLVVCRGLGCPQLASCSQGLRNAPGGQQASDLHQLATTL